MLWLALHLPSLSLEAFCATLPVRGAESRALPVALVAEHRITECNAAAAERGIGAGIKRATALALAPDLLLGEADAGRDALALRAVAHVALSFTPAVTLHEGAATVLMEVQSSLRLFGGLAALHQRVREALVPLAHRVQVAAAPTALGAAVLARWGAAAAKEAGSLAPQGSAKTGDGAGTPRPRRASGREASASFDPVLGAHATRLDELARLLEHAPVWLLGPGREHWEALQGMGLKTLADLRELPRTGLARRFGEGLLLDLDRAFGRAPDPRRWLELPERFESRLELHQRADSAEQVLAAASVLLARLVAWAQARHARIAAFTLSMRHEPRHQGRGAPVPVTELRIEMAEPALDPAHLQLLLRERLARVSLAAPTLELRLRCRELASGAPPNGELFPARASEALGLARLLERLRARLGDAQVQRLEPVADHRPERSSRSTPAQATTRSAVARACVVEREAKARLAASRSAGSVGSRKGVPVVRGAAGADSGEAVAEQGGGAATRAAAVPGAVTVETTASRRGKGRAMPALGANPRPGLPDPAGCETRALPLNRPVWLLPEPVPLPERNALPWLDGQPLQLVSGPERIEAGWWDGAPAARDYFVALAADGSLVWVWRGRLPRTEQAEGGADVQWMLQGRFG